MRITLEETVGFEFSNNTLRKVTIEVDRDDCTIDEMMDDLIKPALLAMTFTKKSIADYFDDEDEE